MRDLGTLGGSFGTANWLNDAAEVIGWSFTSNDALLHAFVWNHGRMIDLGTVQGDISSNAFWINNRGQIVGQSWFWDGRQVTASHAFLWEKGGPMVDLNTLLSNPSDLYLTEANFITEQGMIVANGVLPSGEGRAAILIPESHFDASSGPTPSGPLATNQQRALSLEMNSGRAALQAKVRQYYRRDGWKRSGAPFHPLTIH
jgi:probable HAF family extracellular repeat protein